MLSPVFCGWWQPACCDVSTPLESVEDSLWCIAQCVHRPTGPQAHVPTCWPIARLLLLFPSEDGACFFTFLSINWAYTCFDTWDGAEILDWEFKSQTLNSALTFLPPWNYCLNESEVTTVGIKALSGQPAPTARYILRLLECSALRNFQITNLHELP